MSAKLQYLVEAVEEYEASVEYYDGKQLGLGMRFHQAVEDALALTQEFPDLGSMVEVVQAGVIRRQLVREFAVEIHYLVSSDRILVLAIHHSKRRPRYWRSRLPHLK
jgi:toxin ParE1/3/4